MTFEDPRLALVDLDRNGIADSDGIVIFPNDHLVARRPAEPVIDIVLGRSFDDDIIDDDFNFECFVKCGNMLLFAL